MPDPTTTEPTPARGPANTPPPVASPTEQNPRAATALPAALPTMTPAQRLGMRLRQARLRHNMTQSEVAQKQFSVSYISAVERGQIRPSLGALERLSERLEVPLADLLQDRESANFGLAERSREGGYGSYGDRQRDEVERTLREGLLLLYQGQLAEAITTLQALTGRPLSLPDQVLLRWRLALCYLALEHGEDARREAQEGLVLAERAGDVGLREQLRETLGTALVQLRKYPLALDQFRACQAAIDQNLIRDPIFVLTVRYDLGAVAWSLGDAEQAISALTQAKMLAADVTRPQRLATLYQHLSDDFASTQDTIRARYYGQRSLAASEAAANLRMTGRVYNRLGRVQAQRGQTTEALATLHTALGLAEEQQDVRGIADAQRSLAAIYVAQQQIDVAARAIAVALDRAAEINDPIQRGESVLVLAQIQEARKAHAEAEQSYEQAITLLDAPDAAQHLSDAYAHYSAFLERRGQSKRALELLKQAWQLRDGGAIN